MIGIGWLSLRQLSKSIGERASVADAAPSAFGTGHDPSRPLVQVIPSAIVDDAGKKTIARSIGEKVPVATITRAGGRAGARAAVISLG